MSMCAPIVVFAYNRADKIKECLWYLEKCELAKESDLYIFSDGPKTEKDVDKVDDVRIFLDDYKLSDKFKSITVECAEKNKGLAPSILYGVTKVIEKHNRVIVVEDDLLVNKVFLQYMNRALDYFEDDEKVGCIGAHSYETTNKKAYKDRFYFIRRGECWGWATWKREWELVDWDVNSFNNYKKNLIKRFKFEGIQVGIDKMLRSQLKGEISSWAVRWCYHLYQTGKFTLYPRDSLTQNVGFDGSGTHCHNDNVLRGHIDSIYEITETDFGIAKYSRKMEKEEANFQTNFLRRMKYRVELCIDWIHSIV